MDGVHDGTLIAYLLATWDRIEQACFNQPLPAALTLVGTALLILNRQWPDVLAITALASWLCGHLSTGQLALLALLPSVIGMIQSRIEPSPKSAVDTSVTAYGPQSTCSRVASDADRKLEEVFEGYLRSLVHSSASSIEVTYISCGVTSKRPCIIDSPTAGSSPARLVFKVLKPDFYSRFVHYAHDSEAIFSEFAENETISVDRPDLLTDVFLKKGSPTLHAQGMIDFAYFELIRRLRKRPRKIKRGIARTGPSSVRKSDIRGFRISSMDAYVLSRDDKQLRHMYRSTVLKLFMADQIFGGSYTAFEVAALALRLGLCWATAVFVTTLFLRG